MKCDWCNKEGEPLLGHNASTFPASCPHCSHHNNKAYWNWKLINETLTTLRKELAEAKGEVELNKQEKRFICDPRPNLLHFRWARGNYSNKCGVCAVIFTGDKLAGMCADCAWEKEAKRAEKAEAERDELAKRLATYACFGEKEAT